MWILCKLCLKASVTSIHSAAVESLNLFGKPTSYLETLFLMCNFILLLGLFISEIRSVCYFGNRNLPAHSPPVTCKWVSVINLCWNGQKKHQESVFFVFFFLSHLQSLLGRFHYLPRRIREGRQRKEKWQKMIRLDPSLHCIWGRPMVSRGTWLSSVRGISTCSLIPRQYSPGT